VPDETGFVVPSRNPAALAAALRPCSIRRTCDDGWRGGRKRVAQCFNEQHMVRDTLGVFGRCSNPRARTIYFEDRNAQRKQQNPHSGVRWASAGWPSCWSWSITSAAEQTPMREAWTAGSGGPGDRMVWRGFVLRALGIPDHGHPLRYQGFGGLLAQFLWPANGTVSRFYLGCFWCFFVLLPALSSVRVPGLEKLAVKQSWQWLYCTELAIFLRGDKFFVSDWLQTGHFWSLAMEEQFYLIWPLCVLGMRRESLMKLCGICMAASLG